MTYLLAFLLFFRDELQYIMEKLADVLLFPDAMVFVAVEGEKLAFENNLYDIVLHDGPVLLGLQHFCHQR